MYSMATIHCRSKQEVLDLTCRDLTELIPITNIVEEEKYNLRRENKAETGCHAVVDV